MCWKCARVRKHVIMEMQFCTRRHNSRITDWIKFNKKDTIFEKMGVSMVDLIEETKLAYEFKTNVWRKIAFPNMTLEHCGRYWNTMDTGNLMERWC